MSRPCAQSHDLSHSSELAAEPTEPQAPYKRFIVRGGLLRQQGIRKLPGSSVWGRREEDKRPGWRHCPSFSPSTKPAQTHVPWRKCGPAMQAEQCPVSHTNLVPSWIDSEPDTRGEAWSRTPVIAPEPPATRTCAPLVGNQGHVRAGSRADFPPIEDFGTIFLPFHPHKERRV